MDFLIINFTFWTHRNDSGVVWKVLSIWLWPKSKNRCFNTIFCVLVTGLSSDGYAWSVRDMNCINMKTNKWIVSRSDSSSSVIRLSNPIRFSSLSPPSEWIWPSKHNEMELLTSSRSFTNFCRGNRYWFHIFLFFFFLVQPHANCTIRLKLILIYCIE